MIAPMSKISKRPLLILSLAALSSCSYYMGDTIENITFETLGARNVICYAYIDNVKYKIRPPMKIALKRDKDPMILDCFAPGNRHKKLKIKSTMESSTMLNILNGGIPGGAWDYASDAMFHYPEKIYVDFRGIETTPMPLPDHNSPDIKQPEEYDLEEYLPATPRMNADKHEVPQLIMRRQEYTGDTFSQEVGLSDADLNPSTAPSKGDLSPVKSQPLSAPTSSAPAKSAPANSTSASSPVQLFPLE